MRVLVGYERSGIVRDAFRARGHDAWSCDLEESEKPGPYHFRDHMRHVMCRFDAMFWDLGVVS